MNRFIKNHFEIEKYNELYQQFKIVLTFLLFLYEKVCYEIFFPAHFFSKSPYQCFHDRLLLISQNINYEMWFCI